MKNYYDILNIKFDSNQIEIKKKYRKLSLKYYPDLNKNNKEIIKKYYEIQTAFKVLGNEENRKNYNLTLYNLFNNPYNYNDSFKLENYSNRELENKELKNYELENYELENHELENKELENHELENKELENFKISNYKISNFNKFKVPPIIITKTITFSQSYKGEMMSFDINKFKIINGKQRYYDEKIYINIKQGIDNNEIIKIPNKGNEIEDKIGEILIKIKLIDNSIYTREGLNIKFKKVISLKDSLCGFNFDLVGLDDNLYKISNKKGNIIPNHFQKIIPNLGFQRKDENNNLIYGNLIVEFIINYPLFLEEEVVDILSKIL